MADPIGNALLTLAASRGFQPHDEGPGVAIARFYQEHGRLTDAQRNVAEHILSDPAYEKTVVTQTVVANAPMSRRSEVRFEVADGMIRATTPFSLKDVCKAIPGRKWNPDLKKWEWLAGPIAAMNLRDSFAQWNPDWDQKFESLLSELDTASQFKVATDLEDLPYLKTVAWNHQRQAYHFIKRMKAAGLFMDMGTGKSLVVVSRALEIGGHCLIVAPKKVLGVWPREFRRHGALEVHVENGMRPKRGGGLKSLSVKDRTEAFKKLRDCQCGKRHVYVVNYEATIHEPLKSWLTRQHWDSVVYDEGHKIKSYKGVISKHLAKLAPVSDYRLDLTGTAMPHSPLDIFGQYRALDPGIFGANYTSFKRKYAMWGGYDDQDFLGMRPEMMDEFNRKVFSIAFRVEAGDVLDLPPVLDHQDIVCTLEGQQAKTYKTIEKEMYAEFPGLVISELAEALVNGESTSQNKLGQMLRLRQVTGGAIKDDEGRIVVLGDAKATVLKEWMEDFPEDEPLVVFAAFTADLDAIKRVAEDLGRTYGEVSGRRDDLTGEGEFPPDVDVLGVQESAGGSGVDLTRACYACYYSITYSLGDFEQSMKRLDRPGQTRPVRFYHLLALGTIDIDVYAALAARKELGSQVQDPKHQVILVEGEEEADD